MVVINLAFTAPINPNSAGSAPLTQAQVWQGLERKVRFAQEFVPVIASCNVLEERENGKVVIREVVFKEDESKKVREECILYEPAKVDFKQSNGSTVANTISVDAQGQLYMTYSFEWRHPEIEEGSDKVIEARQKYAKMAQMAVEKSIDSIREMVKDGRIKA